jgi:putative ABC transport system permease protein
MATSFLILLYVADELSYDRFHPEAENIYRVNLVGRINGQDIAVAVTPPPLAQATADELPEVVLTTRVWHTDRVVTHEDKAFKETKIYFVDGTFTEMFHFPALLGDIENALEAPNQAVLTEQTAKKYFGEQDPIGKILVVGSDQVAYQVSAVIQNVPHNTHLQPDILLSFSSLDYSRSTQWLSNNVYTYLKMAPGTSIPSFEAKLKELVERKIGPELEAYFGINVEQFLSSGSAYGYYTIPLTDIYLKSNYQAELTPGSDIQYVYIFSVIGIFILLLACINFMNLSTARSAGRAREVGVRKVMGAQKSALVAQFIGESTIYALLALVLSLLIAALSLPTFNELSGKNLSAFSLFEPTFFMAAFAIALVVGLISGTYPAFYLTAFQPVAVLKGKIKAGMKSGALRNVLVTFQFAISIGLMICTAVVYHQLDYIRNKNLGFEKERLMVINNLAYTNNQHEVLANALKGLHFVDQVSMSNDLPPNIGNTTVMRGMNSEQDHLISQYYADDRHLATMKYELTAGRWFSLDYPSDTMAIVINEAAVKEFGFTQPIGEKIYHFFGDTPVAMEVVGVLKNFHFETLKNNIRPIAILYTKKSNQLTVRLQPGDMKNYLATIEQEWKKVAPGAPFEYKFVDEVFDEQFRAEQRIGAVVIVFTVLAIFIACLGLFGLASFAGEQRTKEIGIRKVMGASSPSLLLLLSKDLSLLVVIAFLLISPIAWYVIDGWLASFAYRVAISPVIFLIAGIGALVIALLTVSYQSMKAISVNPVISLKSE